MIATIGSLVSVGLAGLLGVPVVVLLGEVLAAVMLTRAPRGSVRDAARPRIAVLVPAHNESAGVVPTLQDIKAQLAPGDRVLVVADNCSDDTATAAASAGADVIVRDDLTRVGKGYALDYGFRYLGADPPDVAIIVDADCRLSADAIVQLAALCATTGRPVQALDLMVAPEQSSFKQQIAAFAWRVKNWVRPLGLGALGLPCQLMGTGMAFPWEAVARVDLASGAIVEDLKLGLDLAAAGHAPVFCPAAVVTSRFPVSEAGAATQRERWEQGHIGLIVSGVPRLVLSAVRQGNLPLLVMALDLAVPPLALLALLLLATLTVTVIAAIAGISILAFQISAVACLAYAVAVALAWWRYGRAVLPPAALRSLPAYVWGKCRLYARLLSGRRATQWIRTDRY